jgi:hypothetical protein
VTDARLMPTGRMTLTVTRLCQTGPEVLLACTSYATARIAVRKIKQNPRSENTNMPELEDYNY